MSSEILLNVADLWHHSQVNGPGVRSVIWVQGCTLGCPGCYNSHMQPHRAVKLLDPQQLGRQLAELNDTVGITFSGGEPFQQAHACAILAETVKQAGKSVMVFTGYPFEQLQASAETGVQRFLQTIDLIVAGPYVREQACESRMWRASSNQTVHYLSQKNQAPEPLPESATIEVKTDGQGLILTGFPTPKDLTWFDTLSRQLHRIGA